MIPASPQFAAAITGSHLAVATAQIFDTQGNLLLDLPITDGEVTIDSRRATRRSASLTIPDPTGELTPVTFTDTLAPYSVHEIVISKGVQFPGDQGSEMLQLGVFTITGCDPIDVGGGVSLSIQAEDRSTRVAAQTRTIPLTIDAGRADLSIITAIQDRDPTATILSGAGCFDLPWCVFQPGESDPWADIQDLATASAMSVWVDGLGRYIVGDIPGFTNRQPVATWTQDATDVVVGMSRGMAADQIRNGVIVTGEGSQTFTPMRAEVWDDNPASPTYRKGPLGERPETITSALVVGQWQADSVAQAHSGRLFGQPVTVSIVADPRHEPGDMVTLVRALRPGTLSTANMLIDTVSIPLGPGKMDVGGRCTPWAN